jgi:hypothetical protein
VPLGDTYKNYRNGRKCCSNNNLNLDPKSSLEKFAKDLQGYGTKILYSYHLGNNAVSKPD